MTILKRLARKNLPCRDCHVDSNEHANKHDSKRLDLQEAGLKVRHMRLGVCSLLLSCFVLTASAFQKVTVRDVQAMTSDQVRSGIEVELEGVLTYYEPSHRMAFLEDETGAIYLQIKDALPIAAGERIRVRGRTNQGMDGINIRGESDETSPRLIALGRGLTPKPMNVSMRQVVSGEMGARWVELSGVVKAVELVGDRIQLRLAEAPDFAIFMPLQERLAVLPRHLTGMKVRIEGVTASVPVSESPRVLQWSMLVPGLEHIEIDPVTRNRRFDAVEEPLHALRWLPERCGQRLTRTAGVVTWVKNGAGFFLQRGDRAAWIHCAEPVLPQRGSKVECVGWPETFRGVGILRDVIWRDYASPLETISAVPLNLAEGLTEAWHGRLVTVAAVLVRSFPGPVEDVLVCESSGVPFFARLQRNLGGRSLDHLSLGATLRLTGVCMNRRSPSMELFQASDAFQIELREVMDVEVLRSPPFWTLERMRWLLAGVLVLGLLSAAWLLLLRRTVRRQREIIREQIERDAVQSERVRIAREWHDTMEQHFVGLTMQLDAAASLLAPATLPRDLLDRAAEMADHSRERARQAIWELRLPEVCEGRPFAQILQMNLAGPAMDADTAEIRLHVSASDTVLPGRVAQHVLRIAQEAITNARKHAAARLITVTWKESDAEFELMISDDGVGIDDKILKCATAAGHFGLLGMRERAQKIHATLVVQKLNAKPPFGTLVELVFSRESLLNHE